jgi:fluoride exporter
MTLLLVCVGAALGAPARYLTDRAIRARFGSAFPWGTLVVNVAGSLVLGALVGATTRQHVPAEVVAVLGTGFCGALTTYSTFGHDTLRLAEDGSGGRALLNVLANVAVGAAAAAGGFAAGQVL